MPQPRRKARPDERTPSASSRRAQVLTAVRQAAAPVGVAPIADQLGVHVNTVRFHLDALVASGQVERVTTRSRAPGRPPALFRATRRMDPDGPQRYRLLAGLLVETLAAVPERAALALDAGRAWGRRLGAERPDDGEPPVARLTAVLDEIGFAPDEQDGRPEIALRHCPFLELAREQPGLVCQLHLGLMQGALATWQAPVTVDRLEPFVQPDLCLAHLSAPGGTR